MVIPDTRGRSCKESYTYSLYFSSVNLWKFESYIRKYVEDLRATRSLSVEEPGIQIYILVFFNLLGSSYILFTVSPNDYSLSTEVIY